MPRGVPGSVNPHNVLKAQRFQVVHLALQHVHALRRHLRRARAGGWVGVGGKLGYEAEALAIYDTMCHIKPAVRTLCVGTAYGEAGVLLAAGEKGGRAALPSASIMLRQPMQRFAQMQASDVDIYRNEIRKTKTKLARGWGGGGGGGRGGWVVAQVVARVDAAPTPGPARLAHPHRPPRPPPSLPPQFTLLAINTGQPPAKLEADLAHPKYFNPYQAVEYGIVDKVLAADEAGAKDMVMKSSFNQGLFEEGVVA